MTAPAARGQGRNGRLTGLQLLLALIVFVVAELVWTLLAIVLTLVADPAALGLDGTPRAQSALPLAGGAYLVGAVLAGALAVGGHLLIVGPLARRPGLAVRGRRVLGELALGLVIGAALISLSTGLIAMLGGYRVTGLDPQAELLGPLAIGVGAAFIEEVFFRGAVLRLLDGWLGSGPAVAISSILFGAVHLANPGAGLWGAIAIAVEASILLAGAYLLTRRLWLAIGIHLAWNTVQAGLFSWDVSGTGAQHGLLQAETAGPDWLTGGDMGVEGSVVTVAVGLAAGIVMLVLAHRRGHLLPRESRAARD